MSYSHEVTEAATHWMLRHRATDDPAVLAKIVERAEENHKRLGGNISTSSFERAYLELISEGVIKPFRGSLMDKPSATPDIPPDVIAFITSPRTTASELRHRYNSDRTFRQQYDAFEKTQKQLQPGVFSLTAEQYHSLSAATIVQNYRGDHPKGFKAAVDKLIAQGKI